MRLRAQLFRAAEQCLADPVAVDGVVQGLAHSRVLESWLADVELHRVVLRHRIGVQLVLRLTQQGLKIVGLSGLGQHGEKLVEEERIALGLAQHQLRQRLDPLSYQVLRQAGTERAGTGEYTDTETIGLPAVQRLLHKTPYERASFLETYQSNGVRAARLAAAE